MKRLKSRNGFPPGGWIFFEPATQWSLPNPTAHTFDMAVKAIIAHRHNNPRFNLPTGYEDVAMELENFTITRLNSDPAWVIEGAGAQKKTITPTPLQPEKQERVNLVQRLKQLYSQGKQGKEVLSEWIGEGGIPVSQPLAQNRANTCLVCPKNVQGDILNSLTGSVASLVKSQIEAKEHLSLKLTGEEKLGTCEVCGCFLKLKPWVPLTHILHHTDSLDELPESCWIKQEQKKKVLIAIPYCVHDFNQAKALLEWIGELGDSRDNPCLLVADIKVTSKNREIIQSLALKCFGEVRSITTPYSLPNESWPIGPNWMFQTTLKYVYEEWPLPFLFLEPDAIPLHNRWLTNLQEEYFRIGKPYMGAIVHSSGQAGLPGDHLTGVAIYPADAYERLKPIFSDPRAFDMAMAPLVVPHTHHTNLHQHFWGKMNLAPHFRRDNTPDQPRNTLLLKKINPGASIFHRNKDLSLIALLRATK